MPKLDTCACGSVDFEEYRVTLNLTMTKTIQWGGVTAHKDEIKDKQAWVRFCNGCSQITFWSKPSQNARK